MFDTVKYCIFEVDLRIDLLLSDRYSAQKTLITRMLIIKKGQLILVNNNKKKGEDPPLKNIH